MLLGRRSSSSDNWRQGINAPSVSSPTQAEKGRGQANGLGL